MSTPQEIKQFEKAVLHSNPQQDWIYISEGNKHIVFQYTKSHGILNSLILKINKDINESEDIFASNYIVHKWLGNKYVNNIIHPITLSQSFVLELVNKFQKQRPQKRAEKHPLSNNNNDNTNSKSLTIYHASLESNACSLNTVLTDNHESKQEQQSISTFDMKPKWMFLNVSPFTHSNDIKKHICRFSMHQQLKLSVNNSIETVCQYCPLSLLSNDRNTITKNIQYLLEAKQTNFKIFHRNKEVKSYKFVTKQHLQTIASVIVKHNELFERISMLQRLDTFDITVIFQMFMGLKSRNKLGMIRETMHDCAILDGIINEMEKKYNKTQFRNEKCFCNDGMEVITEIIKKDILCKNDTDNGNVKVTEFVKELSNKQLSLYITQYLLAAIFKDCQVLITLDFNNIDNHKITVVDLNSKPTERIENKWLKQDRAIVQNYVNMFAKSMK